MKMKESIICILYHLFRIIPIKTNRIVFSSFDNTMYGGNPRVISEALMNDNKYELIWILNSDVKIELPPNIKRIDAHSLKKIYYYTTAKLWVDSHHFYNRWKRNDQYLIQTWHAALPLKKMEGNIPQYFSPIHIRQVRKCSEMTDFQISNSDKATEILREGFWYYGPVYQVGMPINDNLINQTPQMISLKKEELGLDVDTKYILYAPTCRMNDEEDYINIMDYDLVADAYSRKFGGTWKILYRGHPIADTYKKEELLNDNVLDVTKVQKINDLLLIADSVITDYSSTITDFMITRKPAFMFAYDYDLYKSRRDFMFPLEDLPFPLAVNNDQMIDVITNFDDKEYQKKLDDTFKKWNVKETGEATMIVVKLIENICSLG